ncbi:TetR family transcriptional regulator [Actinacidiphila glaucinigra]|uniref:TetR family transcriptional regulator n=1 Tax=Actinacidiphila glaucinigra TaxID=235986 RepID=UPI0035E18E77
MAAEESRARILDAALAEFSTFGVAGARVDRIAKAAGVNKNLIYVYFENKETLFSTVLGSNLTKVYADLAFTPEDLPGYAERVFDFAMSNPALMRLIAWNGLEGGAGNPSTRDEAHAAKVAGLEAIRSEGNGAEFSSAFLLTGVMALATAWSAAGPFGSTLGDGQLDHALLRRSIARAVEVLAAT